MKTYIPVLETCQLFTDIAPGDIESMLTCLSFIKRQYPEGADIFTAGDETFQMGVVLSGSVDILQEDFWGNQTILSRLSPADIFAESFVLAQVKSLPVSVVATRASDILLLDYGRILHTCTNACVFHDRLIANLLAIVARKNMTLTQKVAHVTKRTTREKLLSYLSSQARQAGSRRFSIPFDRQALANYLAVDRSAMSSELGRMQKEGLLRVQRNQFELLEGADID